MLANQIDLIYQSEMEAAWISLLHGFTVVVILDTVLPCAFHNMIDMKNDMKND